jgi:hypothetical protein
MSACELHANVAPRLRDAIAVAHQQVVATIPQRRTTARVTKETITGVP